MPRLGLGSSLKKSGGTFLSYIKNNLKLYMPYKGSGTNKGVQFVGTGSTSFDGGTNYISVADSDSLSITGAISISLWVKASAIDHNESGLVAKVNGGGDGYGIYIDADDSKIKFFSEAYNNTADSTAISLNTWYHVVGTHESGDVDKSKIYIDGVLAGTYTETDPMVADSEPLEIGRVFKDDGYNHNGSLKNVAIWNRALTATEVQNVMYKSYAEVSGRLASGLVSWWALDATNLGSNILTNGDLSSATGWTLGTGFTMDTTAQTIGVNNSSGDWQNLINAQTLVSGLTYQVSTTISDYTSGTLRLTFQEGASATLDTFSGVGTNTQSFTCTNSSQKLYLQSSDSGTDTICTISAISVKEVQIEDLEGSNEGSNYGATVDTDLYGGDTPVKPRAIDNAPTVQADAIGAGSALFDADTECISLGATSNFFGTANARTVSCWVKLNDASASNDYFFYFGNTAGTRTGYGMGIKSTDNDLNFHDATTDTATTTTRASMLNTWTHICATYDGSTTVKIYVNGVLDTTIATGGALATDQTATAIIGGRNSGDPLTLGQEIDANVCQMGVWQGALTQEKIQSVMEKTFEELTATEKSSLQTEEINDGDFTTTGTQSTNVQGAVWETEPGWTIASGKATLTNPLGAGYDLVNSLSSSNDNTIVPSTLYKYAFTVESVDGGSVYPRLGNINGTTVSTVGTFTGYIVSDSDSVDGASAFRMGSGGSFTGTIVVKDISCKKVTHDLVSYWALDESIGASGSNNAVHDKMDETFSDELSPQVLFDSDETSSWAPTGSYGTLTFEDDHYILTRDAGDARKWRAISPAPTIGKMYKVSVTAKRVSGSGNIQIGMTNGSDSQSEMWEVTPTSEYQTFTRYIIATSTETHAVLWNKSANDVVHYKGYSIKEANGNAGVLV